MTKLLSDIPAYKLQKQNAKALFRKMQLMDVDPIVALLPNSVVLHYRPMEGDFKMKIKSWFVRLFDSFKFYSRKIIRRKRNVRVIKSENEYQKIVWDSLCKCTREFLQNVVENPTKCQSSKILLNALSRLNTNVFLCTEQAIQIAFLESMRYFSIEQLSALDVYQDVIEVGDHEPPPFFFELFRAWQWTQLLRREMIALKAKKRTEPDFPVENNIELIFR